MPATPRELMQRLQGRWYRCAEGHELFMYWSPVALDIGRGVWRGLELDGKGRFVPARPHLEYGAPRPTPAPKGTFQTMTYATFVVRANENNDEGGSPTSSIPEGEAAREPVLVVPQPRNGLIMPQMGIVFSEEPRTFAVQGDRYLGVD